VLGARAGNVIISKQFLSHYNVENRKTKMTIAEGCMGSIHIPGVVKHKVQVESLQGKVKVPTGHSCSVLVMEGSTSDLLSSCSALVVLCILAQFLNNIFITSQFYSEKNNSYHPCFCEEISLYEYFCFSTWLGAF
jgi:hypothetical protein